MGLQLSVGIGGGLHEEQAGATGWEGVGAGGWGVEKEKTGQRCEERGRVSTLLKGMWCNSGQYSIDRNLVQ